MKKEANLVKAVLQEIGWTEQGKVKEVDNPKTVTVQFNPETLKVSFSNQKSGGDQAGGSAIQFVGQGTTSLSLELWFDVTVLPAERQEINDVRLLTHDVAHFIMPKEENRRRSQDNKVQFIPPGVRFSWGSFLFEGVMDSMDENLEFFSEDGRPLRASVSIKLSRQEILFRRPQEGQGGSQGQQQPARAGDSVQKLASDAGRPDDWKSIAEANGIENPRQLAPGTMVDLGAGGGLGAGAVAGLSSSAGLTTSAGLTGGAGLSALESGFGVSGGASLGLGGSFSAGGAVGLGGSASIGGGASLGGSINAGGAVGLGGSVSAGGGASLEGSVS
jgi:hypothetical protein